MDERLKFVARRLAVETLVCMARQSYLSLTYFLQPRSHSCLRGMIRFPTGRKHDFKDAERLVRRLIANELIYSFVPNGEQLFDTSTCANSPGPAMPRSIGRLGASACTMQSHFVRLNFEPSCRITTKLAGTYSSISETPSPDLRNSPWHCRHTVSFGT